MPLIGNGLPAKKKKFVFFKGKYGLLLLPNIMHHKCILLHKEDIELTFIVCMYACNFISAKQYYCWDFSFGRVRRKNCEPSWPIV